MEVYKAKRDGVAVFLNPDKFEKFLRDILFIMSAIWRIKAQTNYFFSRIK